MPSKVLEAYEILRWGDLLVVAAGNHGITWPGETLNQERNVQSLVWLEYTYFIILIILMSIYLIYLVLFTYADVMFWCCVVQRHSSSSSSFPCFLVMGQFKYIQVYSTVYRARTNRFLRSIFLCFQGHSLVQGHTSLEIWKIYWLLYFREKFIWLRLTD